MTALLVTHDQAEAMSMSDQVVLMRGGQIVQQGSPREIFLRPSTDFAADFMGRSNLLQGRICRSAGLDVAVDTVLGELRCVATRHYAVGEAVKVAMRPSAFEPANAGPSGPACNLVSGTVRQITYHGEQVEIALAAADATLRVLVGPFVDVAVGDVLALRIETRQCVAVDILDGAPAPPAPVAAPTPQMAEAY